MREKLVAIFLQVDNVRAAATFHRKPLIRVTNVIFSSLNRSQVFLRKSTTASLAEQQLSATAEGNVVKNIEFSSTYLTPVPFKYEDQKYNCGKAVI